VRAKGSPHQGALRASLPPRQEFEYALTVWQSELLAYCKGVAKPRVIYNVWSNESGTGKSSITRILRANGLSVLVAPVTGDIKDQANIIMMYDHQEVVVFDVPRQGALNDHLYTLLEMVSDHRIATSGKYEGKQVAFKSHVIVCSNRPLEDENLPGRIHFIPVETLDKEVYAEVEIDMDDGIYDP
jgi:protein tyrosine phosphatase (PTP) superfamily phosphohydrolase (DUF442 family)